MKNLTSKTVVLSFFLLIISGKTFTQNSLRVSNSEIQKIRIYQSGAFVSRSVKVNLNAGINEIVFDKLSPYINANSISVKGFGEATIVGVNFQQNYLKIQKTSSEITKLEGEKDSLTIKLRYIQNKIMACNEGLAVLQANRSIGGANNGIDAAKLTALVEYQIKKINSLKDEIIDLGIKDQGLQNQITKINQQLSVLNSKQNQSEGNIIVTVNSSSKSLASFEFSYLINSNVRWTPVYDIRVKNTSSPMEFILKAKVYQSTGEDWTDVKLSLNTSNPTDRVQKPNLTPWYLNFQQEADLYSNMRGSRVDQESDAPMMNKLQEIKVKMDTMRWSNAQIIENQLNNEYEIENKYTLKSGNVETQIEINRINANAYYEYASAPKLNSDAFLMGNIINWESLNLLNAEGSVYFDGAFVGTTYIQNTSSKDTMNLSLGKDERIIIKRTKLNEVNGSNLFGNVKEKKFSYDIVVKNTKKETVEITIEEQLPISQDKNIAVNALELSGGKLNPTTGLVTWKISLKAGESSTKKFNFSVKFPKDTSVNGL
ncbi:MAG: mucoidy inhibitor MuiA family protein [Crocinitomicaceae bacterium]|nr:mucoidy inhibitor MuiA family protein [Crocinitomicaceae bacterium]